MVGEGREAPSSLHLWFLMSGNPGSRCQEILWKGGYKGRYGKSEVHVGQLSVQ